MFPRLPALLVVIALFAALLAVACSGDAKARDCQPDEPCHCEISRDYDRDGHDAVACGGDDCADTAAGYAVGDWAHCGQCGHACSSRQACVAEQCVPARRVFVTSRLYSGDLGGVQGADIVCQTHADNAGLGGRWRAFIQDSTATLAERLEHATVPYVRLDGVVVADNWTDLTDGSIQTYLMVTETRTRATSKMWTGLVNIIGDGAGSNCRDWTQSLSSAECCTGVYGGAGLSAFLNELWDGYYIYGCDMQNGLYCIEQ